VLDGVEGGRAVERVFPKAGGLVAGAWRVLAWVFGLDGKDGGGVFGWGKKVRKTLHISTKALSISFFFAGGFRSSANETRLPSLMAMVIDRPR